jgi:hypothetical protein
VQLIVELEKALPSWFLNQFKMYKLVSHPNRTWKMKRLVSDSLIAVQLKSDEEQDTKRTVATSVVEIRSKQQQLEEWLNALSNSLDKQMELLKQLAVAVKQAETNAFQQLRQDRKTSIAQLLLRKKHRMAVAQDKVQLEMPHLPTPRWQTSKDP